MKKWEFTFGIDVSKCTLDIHCAEHKKHIIIKNDSSGFKQFLKWAKELKVELAKSIIVFEHTGGYEFKLMQFCTSNKITFCRVPGLDIKKSMGIVRGKNDRVDAKRIAIYATEKQNRLTPSKPIDLVVLQLKDLINLRKRIVRENAGYKASISERKHMYEVKNSDLIIKTLKQKLKQNELMLNQIEKEIHEIIYNNDDLHLNYKYLTSIKGIGPINALMTIIFTENFTKFNDARKYGVYAGVVPFDHSSGTSINGRRKISFLANKEVKQELNQAAKSALIHNPELREYGERLLQNNKHYKIVLNNIKFKLITRMFAVVKRKEVYVEKLKKCA